MSAYELMRFVIIAIRKLPKEISVMSCFLCCECIQRKIIFSFGMFLETGLHFTIKATTTVITSSFFSLGLPSFAHPILPEIAIALLCLCFIILSSKQIQRKNRCRIFSCLISLSHTIK